MFYLITIKWNYCLSSALCLVEKKTLLLSVCRFICPSASVRVSIYCEPWDRTKISSISPPILRQLRVVFNSLSTGVCMMLVHAFVSSRLDNCNSRLARVSGELVKRLKSVLRLAARLVLRKRKFDPVSNDLPERLHWLPIRQRIQYKLVLLVYKCLAPSYLSDMLALVSADPYSFRLRSAAHGDLNVPWTRTVQMGGSS